MKCLLRLPVFFEPLVQSALAEIVNIVDVVSSNRLVRLTEDEIADGSTAFALNEAETMPLPAEEDKEDEEKSSAASVATTPAATPAAGSPVCVAGPLWNTCVHLHLLSHLLSRVLILACAHPVSLIL